MEFCTFLGCQVATFKSGIFEMIEPASKLEIPVEASALTLAAVEMLASNIVGAVDVSVGELLRMTVVMASKFGEFKFAAPIPLDDSLSRGWSIMSEYSRSRNDANMQKTEATTMTAAAAAATFIGFTILNKFVCTFLNVYY
jgi:ribose/xylose/arabinose/galactoside ABC-type transport system permease subunit